MATRNIVPRGNEEGTIGTLIKRWLGGFFRWLDIENYIQFTPNTNPSHQEGRMFYDSLEHTLSVYNENDEMTHNLGQEHIVRVYNDTGSEIANGKIVRIDTVDDDFSHPTIILAQADIEDNAHALGMTTTSIPDKEHGYVTMIGIVHDIDTSSFSTGDVLYLSDTTAGGVTITKPTIVTLIGVVLRVHATEGTICVALEEYGAVGADMLKSVYDPDVDGVVDKASSICIFARKASSGSIPINTPVYITGWNAGGWVEVEEADASNVNKMPALGISSTELINSVTGKVVGFGRLTGIDTSSYNVGDSLFVSTTAGQLTATKPQGNNYIQKICHVLKADVDGIIEIFGAGRSNDIPNIYPYTEKVTPHDEDTLFLEDYEDSYNKKKLKISAFGIHTHSNKTEIDLVTDGNHDIRIDNPHIVTKTQVGLNNVPNLDTTDAVNNEHAHSNKTELDLVTDGDHDARTDNPHDVSEATKEVFFQADYGSNEGNFRTRAVGSTSNFNFNFKVPHDFSSIDSIVVCGIITGGGVIGSGRDIDLFSEYGGANEAHDNHAESDTTSLFDFSSNVQFDIVEIDISTVFTNLGAGDYCGINIDHKNIGGTIEYLGVCLKYN